MIPSKYFPLKLLIVALAAASGRMRNNYTPGQQPTRLHVLREVRQ